MMTSINWIPPTWGLGVPSDDQRDDEAVPAGTVVHQLAQDAEFNDVAPQTFSLFVVPDDVDECKDPEPFDAEEFVDRLVEDDAPVWGTTGEVRSAGVWEALDASIPAGATGAAGGQATKLFLHPMFAWESSTYDQDEYHAEGCNQPGHEQPTLIPYDPFLDTLLSSSLSSPEIVPTVTTGLAGGSIAVCLGNGSKLGAGSSVLPPVVDSLLPPDTSAKIGVSVPMAPSRVSRSSWPVPAPSPPRLMSNITTSLQPQHHHQTFSVHQQPQHTEYQQSQSNLQVGMMEERFVNMVTLNMTSMAPVGALARAGVQDEGVLRLTGAEGFSNEYDDQQFAFLRQQEVDSYVGPGYLSGIVRLGLVTPTNRALLVDWVTGLHAAAPATCGDSPPLSLDTLFLAVNIIDRFLSTREGAKAAVAGDSAMKLAAAAALSLASKYEDSQPPSLWGIAMAMNMGLTGSERDGHCRVCAGVGGNGPGCDGESGGSAACSCDGAGAGAVREAKRELAASEMRIFSALKFRLTVPTALSFLGVYLRRAEGLGYLRSRVATEQVRAEAERILQCLLRDAWSIEHPASAVAAAALYRAFCITSPGEAAPTPFAFFAVTGYGVEELRPCMRDMEEVQTGASMHHLFSADSLGASIKRRQEPDSTERVPQSFFSPGFGQPAITAL